jgi:hypothetical protein
MSPPPPRAPWLDLLLPADPASGCVHWNGPFRRKNTRKGVSLFPLMRSLPVGKRRADARPVIARFHALPGTETGSFFVRMSCGSWHCVAPAHMRIVQMLSRAHRAPRPVAALPLPVPGLVSPIRTLKRSHDALSATMSASAASEDEGDCDISEEEDGCSGPTIVAEPPCKRARLMPPGLAHLLSCEAPHAAPVPPFALPLHSV